MKTFSFTGANKIVFGRGAFASLPEHLRDLKISRPLVVIDRNLAEAGFRDKVSAVLEGTRIPYALYDKTEPEPPLELADEGTRLALKKRCDGVVGIGGGSAMDLAKAIAVLAANKAKAEDSLGLNKVPGPGLPKIMVPTTAGTGSEVTFTAVFIRKKLQKKEGINSPYLYPELALLDPELTLSLPPHPTATTGIDALCHAIESSTSNIEAREAMLLGSLYAGLGLANAGVTAVHSLSYPLGGKYGVSHGLANTIMLPRVMAFNLPGALEKFVNVAEVMGEVVDDLPLREAAFLAVEAVEALIEDCGVMTTLEELEIPQEEFAELAKVALTVARPLANNPCKMTAEEMVELYQEAYS
jgi:alcohol dehydrogenase